MNRLLEIKTYEDIPQNYRNTPIGDLLEYHNLNRPLDPLEKAKMLIGMCMDNRKTLRIPDNFAFILRTGGGNLRWEEKCL
jgi:carbonic anhydrase